MNRQFLEQLYSHLSSAYGQQGWWPLLNRKTRQLFYDPQYKLRELQPEEMDEVIIGALLTQNTSWNNVVLALANLADRHLMTFDVLARSDDKVVAELVRPSRYFRQKAERLILIAREVQHYGYPALRQMKVPELRQWLLALKGIGNETADSILLYAFHHPQFVIDAYTKRFLVRYGLVSDKENYHQLKARFQEVLPLDTVLFNEFHALIVRHCTDVCQSKPKCENCLFQTTCPTGQHHTVSNRKG